MIPRSQLFNLSTLQLDLNMISQQNRDAFFLFLSLLIMVDNITRAVIPVVGGSLFRFSTSIESSQPGFTVHRHLLKQNRDPKPSNAFVFCSVVTCC